MSTRHEPEADAEDCIADIKFWIAAEMYDEADAKPDPDAVRHRADLLYESAEEHRDRAARLRRSARPDETILADTTEDRTGESWVAG
jgi:hypothetical protein